MRRIPRPSPATVIALVALIISVAGTAYATGEGDPLLGGTRNPGTNKSQALTRETQIIANTGTYGTRQSNKSSDGGGAIYGCRSRAGGTATGNEPCLRADNLSTGLAFEFVSSGSTGGLIKIRDAAGRPFTTNATGVATGLNADRVDSLDADQLVGTARAGLVPLSKIALSSPTASNADLAAARAAATEIPLGSFGPFAIYAKCFVDSDGGTGNIPLVHAEVYARTTQNDSVLDGQEDNLDGNVGYLNTTTPEDERQVDLELAEANQVGMDFDDDISVLMAPDGSAYEFHVSLAAKSGTPPAGNGPWGADQRCGFGLSRYNPS